MKRLLVAAALVALAVLPLQGSLLVSNAAAQNAPSVPGLGAVTGAPAQAGGAMPGLDAASAAPTAPGQWRVLVASRLNDGQAQQFARTLRADGFDPVTVEDRAGTKAVLVGAMPNEAAARALMQTLTRDMAYSVEGIEGPGAAPGARTTTPAAAPPGAQVWRVVVDEFSGRGRATDEQAAGKLRETLLQDDYLNVEVDEAGPDIFRVTMGAFPTEADAGKLAELLRSEGYARASAKQIAGGTAAPTGAPEELAAPTLLPIPQLTTEQMAGLTPDQQRELYDLLRELRAAQDGKPLTFEETQRLTARVRAAEGRFGEVLATAREAQRIRADLDRRIFNIYRDFNRALLEQKYDEAQAKLDEIRSLDPNEENLQARQDRLARQRGGGAAPGGDDTEQLRRQADEAYAKGDLAAALRSYQTLLARNPSSSELAVRIGEINSRMAGEKPVSAGTTASGQGMPAWALYGGIALLVVILLLAGMQFANMRRERQLLQEVKELASNTGKMKAVPDPAAAKPSGRKPAPAKAAAKPAAGKGALAGGSALAGMDAFAPMPDPVITAEQQEEPEEVPASEEETVDSGPVPIMEKRPHGEPDVLVLHDVSAPPPPAPAPAPAKPAMAESIDLSGLDFSTPMPAAPSVAEPADESPFGPGGLKLDDLPTLGNLSGGIPAPVESAPIPPPPAVADSPATAASVSLPEDLVPMGAQEIPPPPPPPPPAPAEAFAETARIDIPPPPVAEPAAPEPAPIPPPPAAPAAPAEAEVFFAQDFSSFAVGEKPDGWQGEYDYASLTVADDNPPEGAAKYLKFEKRSGAGSANYACRFPNASGRVKVDFDLRCDDKNKYLLGFYIEKDEDFKQSVHTIVHRTDSRTQPTLRIHGEPIPYELGTWRHICYRIDLLSGLVSASVNGEEVVREAKLPSNPAFVNTLSIRDNLATTGVLCIANLRISKG